MVGGEDVEGEGVQLDPDVERDEIAGRHHHAHADGGEDDQDRELEAGDVHPLHPAAAQNHGEGRGDVDRDLGVDGQRVGDIGAVEGLTQRAGGGDGGRCDQQGHRQDGDQPSRLLADEGAEQEQDESADRERQLRGGEVQGVGQVRHYSLTRRSRAASR